MRHRGVVTAREVARGLSIFEIDESLEALIEEAEVDAEANNGVISDAIKSALAIYAKAFGYKVDRIADFLKAQRAEAEIAQREAERFHNRHNAAENREKRLKQLLVWFMLSRNMPKLRGEFNTISLQANSTPSLVIQDASHIVIGSRGEMPDSNPAQKTAYGRGADNANGSGGESASCSFPRRAIYRSGCCKWRSCPVVCRAAVPKTRSSREDGVHDAGG